MAEAAERIDVMADADGAPVIADSVAEAVAEVPTAPHGPVLLLDRYQIEPARPLSQLDSPSAKAFVAEDRRDTSREVFALIGMPGLPPRTNVMQVMRSGSMTGMVPLVDSGTVLWSPLGQRCLAMIFERPIGGRLAPTPFSTGHRISEHEVARQVVDPVVRALLRLSARGLTHRAVRPDNLFFMDTELREVVLGDCVSSPPGFDQPMVFETIERGMAGPGGRGEGTPAEDLYALGVTLAFILVGGNPVHNLTDDQVIRLKIERSSYGAICGNAPVPLSMIEPLRGLLSDNPEERWGFEEVQMWIAGGRRTPIQRRASRRADNGLIFNGREYFSPRTVAHAFAANPAEAAPIVRDGRLENWLRRQLMDAELSDTVLAAVEVSRAHQNDPLGSDDYLVCKVCIVLDTVGPIRYKGFAFIPEGFGPALAVEILRRGEVQVPAEIIARDIAGVWLDAQGRSRITYGSIEKLFTQLRMFLQTAEMGYGIERCLYHMNPGLPCQSPVVIQDYVTTVQGLMLALEEAAKRVDTKGRPMDRHIAAFIAVRFDQDVSRQLQALSGSDEERAMLSLLSLFAIMQQRLGVESLFGLSSWVGGHLGPAISSYRSRSTRRELEREMPRVVRQGSLPHLLNLIDNSENRQNDTDGYALAEAQYSAAETEIEEIEISDTARAESAETIGQQSAAMASIVLTMLIVCVLFLMETW